MKYILSLLSISAFIIFSSMSSVSAEEGYLEELLQLSTGLESYKMEEIPKLETRSFSNTAVQKTFNEFQKLDTILRKEFTRQFDAGDIPYYQMQDLITNYTDFLYFTNKTFSYVSEHEKWLRWEEINRAIESGYSNMRMSYGRIKGILER